MEARHQENHVSESDQSRNLELNKMMARKGILFLAVAALVSLHLFIYLKKIKLVGMDAKFELRDILNYSS